jgi:hypothetical protein
MPVNMVQKYADETGKSVSEVEKLWTKAKEVAKEAGRKEDDENFYPYVVGILKKMLGLKEEDVSQATSTTSSAGVDSPVPASGSGMGSTQTKMGQTRKRKRAHLINFREYLEHNT